MVQRSGRVGRLATAWAQGAVSGLAGVAVMTVGEKVEQALTHRPDSYVPARALLALLGRPAGEDEQPPVWNHLMHWGTGAAVGGLRGVWAVTGIRGPIANAWHTVVRLAVDQTIENATGAGAPPATWPRAEQAVDTLHKAVYSTVTGLVADRWIRPELQSRQGRVSH